MSGGIELYKYPVSRLSYNTIFITYGIWNGFAYIDHAFDIICSLRLQERKSFELVLHKTIDHVTFLCPDHCSKGLDLFHSIFINIYSNHSRKRVSDMVTAEILKDLKKNEGKSSYNFIAIYLKHMNVNFVF